MNEKPCANCINDGNQASKNINACYNCYTSIMSYTKFQPKQQVKVEPEIADITKITMWVDMIWNDIFDDDELPLTAAQMNIIGKYINNAKEKIRQQFKTESN